MWCPAWITLSLWSSTSHFKMKKSSVSFPVFDLAVKIVGKNGRVSVVEIEWEFQVCALNAESHKLLDGFKGRMGILRFWSHLWLSCRKRRAPVLSWGNICFTGSSTYDRVTMIQPWYKSLGNSDLQTLKSTHSHGIAIQPPGKQLLFTTGCSLLRSHDCICGLFCWFPWKNAHWGSWVCLVTTWFS